jgi:hypothetical protein
VVVEEVVDIEEGVAVVVAVEVGVEEEAVEEEEVFDLVWTRMPN